MMQSGQPRTYFSLPKERKGNTLDFDPESMKRLTILFTALKGIYIYMDMPHIEIQKGDGVEAASEPGDAARPYCI